MQTKEVQGKLWSSAPGDWAKIPGTHVYSNV